MANISAQIHNIQQMVDFLDDVKGLEFLDKAVFESIGEQVKIQTETRFAKQEDPDGKAWASLSEKYGASKPQKARHNKILQFAGGLIDTLATEANDYGLKFGSNRIYSATHQYGREEDGIPARPFLGFSDDDKKAIAEELKEAWEVWLAENS